MAISSHFTRRESSALSYLSASCPAVAENRKKGRMKMPAARFASKPDDRLLHCAVWNVISTTKAFLNRLSLKAPRNCVAKNGLKRRVLNRENCELMMAPCVVYALFMGGGMRRVLKQYLPQRHLP